MRPLPNESYEAWASRASMFEKGRALQRIANGEPAEQVVEEMSRRLTEKLMHPIFKAIRESAITDYDPVKNKERYEQTMRYHTPVADHVDGNLFDKPE